MAQQPLRAIAVDPDHVSEVLCDGAVYLTWAGNLGTLTFTHARPNAASLFANDLIENEFVVRARVVMSLSNMIALRDLLNDKIRSDQAGAASASAGTIKH
jgi:hypothetical protein